MIMISSPGNFLSHTQAIWLNEEAAKTMRGNMRYSQCI